MADQSFSDFAAAANEGNKKVTGRLTPDVAHDGEEMTETDPVPLVSTMERLTTAEGIRSVNDNEALHALELPTIETEKLIYFIEHLAAKNSTTILSVQKISAKVDDFIHFEERFAAWIRDGIRLVETAKKQNGLLNKHNCIGIQESYFTRSKEQLAGQARALDQAKEQCSGRINDLTRIKQRYSNIVNTFTRNGEELTMMIPDIRAYVGEDGATFIHHAALGEKILDVAKAVIAGETWCKIRLASMEKMEQNMHIK